MAQQQYGIKIAQPGYDVRTAKDYQLIFNSSWPTLAIAYDQTSAYTTDSYGSLRIAHNLGFVPLAMAWQFTDSTMTVQEGRVFPSVDKTYLYFILEFANNTTIYLNVKCYNLDITTPQSYNYVQSAAITGTYNSQYGIKVVKQNQSIQSKDLRSFILHSRAASPQVLAVITDQTNYNSSSVVGNNNGTLTYTNPQGYTAWAFGYAQVTAFNYNVPVYEWADPVSQAFPIIQFNGGNYGNNVSQGLVTMSLAGGTGKGSIIVLRDPLIASTSVKATY